MMSQQTASRELRDIKIGPLHDPVTWYKIKYSGEQVAQWDFQNKSRCIVLEVPLRNLLTSTFNFVPCDWVVQRAYCPQTNRTGGKLKTTVLRLGYVKLNALTITSVVTELQTVHLVIL